MVSKAGGGARLRFPLLARASSPHVAFLGRVPGTNSYSDLARHADNDELPNVIAFRPEASLLYINADSVLEAVLQHLEFFGFCPTRNLAKRPGKKASLKASGCSIVAEALGRLGIHMSEANVVACWRKHGHLIRPT